MKNLYTTLLTILHTVFCFSQAPTVEWSRTLGGSLSETAKCVVKVNDGGFLFAGNTLSIDGDVDQNHSGNTIWLVKTDGNGQILWKKTYLFNSTGNAEITKLKIVSGGGFLMCGNIYLDDNNLSQFMAVKLNSDGVVDWFRMFGGTEADFANDICEATDSSGYVICGATKSNDGEVSGNHSSNYDYWTVKIDFDGDLVWQKALGGFFDDWASSITATNDNGFLVAGYTYNYNNGDVGVGFPNLASRRDIWVVKLDSVGNIVWNKLYGGSEDDIASVIKSTTDGGFLLTGNTRSNDYDVSGTHVNGSYYDIWAAKMNASGVIEWQKALGGSGNEDQPSDIIPLSDGNFALFGSANSNTLASDITVNYGFYDYWLVKLSTTGSIIWQKSFGGSSSDIAKSIQQTNDGGFVLLGDSRSNNIDVSGNQGESDYWMLKLYSENLQAQSFNKTVVSVYPNPVNKTLFVATDSTILDIKIIDALGRSSATVTGFSNNSIDVTHLAIGFYYLQMITNQGMFTEKFIKQ